MPRRRLKRLTDRFEQIPKPQPAEAMRRALRSGYGAKDFRADVLAGVVVGIVALPLSMALAIAVSARPETGLYTAIVGGAIVAMLGGSRFQVTGPTAAFIVILSPIVAQYGIRGLLLAGMLAGLMLIGMGLFKLGRLITFIPHPVTTGFTSGIGVVIATLQIKDVLGLKIAVQPDGYLDKLHALWGARSTFDWHELAVAATTLALLLVIPKLQKKIPAPLLAIGFVTIATAIVSRFVPAFHVRTIPPIPRLPPHFSLPWGDHPPDLATIRVLIPKAFAIAMLGAIESLLSAVIADGMTGGKHDPDAELLALGTGNFIVPFFGGIPATGALARTATNVRSGARSPISSVVHSVFVLLAILIAAPALAFVPIASLAALMMLVAWNMSEVKHFRHILAIAPKSDVSVLLICFLLTVFVDMVAAVSVGVVLAALLFMRRMAEITQTRVSTGDELSLDHPLPAGVVLYEIAGPMFFGAAARAVEALGEIGAGTRVVILYLGSVPAIDATGLVALEAALERLTSDNRHVIISGPLPQPQRVFDKANLEADEHVVIAKTLTEAIAAAEAFLAGHGGVGHEDIAVPSSMRKISARAPAR
ncbi:MAG: SulP family inorganic anion transporter [Polyangiales bacterium]